MDFDNDTDNRYSVKRKLVDLEFVAIDKYALGDGETFNMSGLNEKYISLLIEHGIDETSDNYKKYIEDFLQKSVDNINFVRPSRKNESENVVLNETVSNAVDSFLDEYSNWDSDLIRLTKMMRKELLESRGDWKFVGKLTENIKKHLYWNFFWDNCYLVPILWIWIINVYLKFSVLLILFSKY